MYSVFPRKGKGGEGRGGEGKEKERKGKERRGQVEGPSLQVSG